MKERRAGAELAEQEARGRGQGDVAEVGVHNAPFSRAQWLVTFEGP